MSRAQTTAGHRADTAPATERIGMIYARTTDGVIGAAGSMPWSVPEDLAHFKRTTIGHPVIMGRKTWDSFPEKFRPLPGRTNIVITRNEAARREMTAAGATVVSSPEQALKTARAAEGSEEIWIIGGGEIFDALADAASLAVITVINSAAPGDTRAPQLDSTWKSTMVEPANGWLTSSSTQEYRIELWEKN
ncbi:dihydrofolate reductase [Paeniglutamicibacter cryotolerans]|uniref:Dihydrofolate reductase n=1 Tax=Paeniglutamicibacter cryotolerans TaxID=670079 RepID=A0A839QDP1_9MICC|nr:dihydrofolate reductase [Paeniglutamicibacter cryotolerans]MBB2994020.1 dihydrofolate reductase [Paeniglutamicibacter cryotolerans]